MHTITVESSQYRQTLSVPSSFDEMDGKQLFAAAAILLGEKSDRHIINLTGIEREVLEELTPYQQYAILELFDDFRKQVENLSFNPTFPKNFFFIFF